MTQKQSNKSKSKCCGLFSSKKNKVAPVVQSIGEMVDMVSNVSYHQQKEVVNFEFQDDKILANFNSQLQKYERVKKFMPMNDSDNSSVNDSTEEMTASQLQVKELTRTINQTQLECVEIKKSKPIRKDSDNSSVLTVVAMEKLQKTVTDTAIILNRNVSYVQHIPYEKIPKVMNDILKQNPNNILAMNSGVRKALRYNEPVKDWLVGNSYVDSKDLQID